MSHIFHAQWVEAYMQAALEVDGSKMPDRIISARNRITDREEQLQGSADHHAERHEMKAALAALVILGEEALEW